MKLIIISLFIILSLFTNSYAKQFPIHAEVQMSNAIRDYDGYIEYNDLRVDSTLYFILDDQGKITRIVPVASTIITFK